MAGKFEMRHSEVNYSWSTMVASSFWDMRLTAACVATDAEYQRSVQNRITQRDRTLSFPVVARQPHPDPNFAPHSARRAACRHRAEPKGTAPPQGEAGAAGAAGAASGELLGVRSSGFEWFAPCVFSHILSRGPIPELWS